MTFRAQLHVIHKICSELASSGQSRVFQRRISVHDQSMLFSFLEHDDMGLIRLGD
jgi:hypothetical protein